MEPSELDTLSAIFYFCFCSRPKYYMYDIAEGL